MSTSDLGSVCREWLKREIEADNQAGVCDATLPHSEIIYVECACPQQYDMAISQETELLIIILCAFIAMIVIVSLIFYLVSRKCGFIKNREEDKSYGALEETHVSNEHEDDHGKNQNVLFYNNKIPFLPDGDLIDTVHQNWWGDYEKLERNHNYIQWLFPINEAGMNPDSQVLHPHEAQAIQHNPRACERLTNSYRMMLDFYGMRMFNERTGTIQRAPNWEERFANLDRSRHNSLRITRILKCLGQLGQDHLKLPLVEFLIEEIRVQKTLQNCGNSCKDYWIKTIKEENELIRLLELFNLRDPSSVEEEPPFENGN